jgi:predicted amidohydrolase YtcJ
LKAAPHKIDRTFASKILMPGFIEPHGHPILASTTYNLPLLTYLPLDNPYGKDFPGVKTQAAVVDALRKYVAQAKSPDETVVAWGYDVIAMGGKHLDKTQLDRISATQPLIIWDASEHYAYANSAALKKYKITKEDIAKNGAGAGADGEPNGQFLGVTALRRIMQEPLNDLLQPAVAYKNVRYLMDLSRKNGITTTSDLTFGGINLEMEQFVTNKYFNDPASPMRVVQIADTTAFTALKGDQAVAFVQGLTKGNTDRVILNGAKLFADDAYLSNSMRMENPGYIDGSTGVWVTPPDKMVATWLPWWKSGLQLHAHSNGDVANTATLNALAELMRVYPRVDHRFTLEHFGISSPDQIFKVKALGAFVGLNPYFLYNRAAFSAPYIGERARINPRLKSMVDAGVLTALHSDSPVGPPKPLEMAWIAINRISRAGQVDGPAERVSVDQAMRMVTINAAVMLGVDDKVGSIVTGKFADFAVLDQDPYAVPKVQIKDIKVWGTVSGGRVFPASEIRQ